MTKSRWGMLLGALLFGGLAANPAQAVTITTTNLGTLSGPLTRAGTLANQGEVLEATFAISSASQLTIFTDSYGGGTNANGSTAAAGGFMSHLVLYNGAGNFIAGETFPSPIGTADPATRLVGDSYLKTANLAPGTYILTLSDFLVQQPPTAGNLSDGFIDYGSGTTFADVQGNVRTGSYSLNITGAASSSVPEPATFWLVIPLLGGVIALVRRNAGVFSKEQA